MDSVKLNESKEEYEGKTNHFAKTIPNMNMEEDSKINYYDKEKRNKDTEDIIRPKIEKDESQKTPEIKKMLSFDSQIAIEEEVVVVSNKQKSQSSEYIERGIFNQRRKGNEEGAKLEEAKKISANKLPKAPQEERKLGGQSETIEFRREKVAKLMLQSKDPINFKIENSDKVLRMFVKDEVGRGGFSAVYQAYSVDDLRDYVLKVPLELSKDTKEKEVIYQKKLQLAAPTSFTTFIGISIIQMEEVDIPLKVTIEEFEAATLEELLSGRKDLIEIENRRAPESYTDFRFKAGEVYNFLEQFIIILKTFENTKIFHLDIKPQNILVDSATWSMLKMTDFGTAIYIPRYSPGKSVEVGEGSFSKDYSSPERLESIDLYQKRKILVTKYEPMKAEIYSFGLILEEILTLADEGSTKLFQKIANKMTKKNWEERISLDNLCKSIQEIEIHEQISDQECIVRVEQKVTVTKWLKLELLRRLYNAWPSPKVFVHKEQAGLLESIVVVEFMELFIYCIDLRIENLVDLPEKKWNMSLIERLRDIGNYLLSSNQFDENIKSFVKERMNRLDQSVNGQARDDLICRAAKCDQRSSDRVTFVEYVIKAGNHFLEIGAVDKGIWCLKIGSDIRRKLVGNSDLSYAQVLANIGDSYFKQGEYAKALEYYKQTGKIQKKILNKNHPRYAITLGNIGSVYSVEGEYSKALESYNRCEQIFTHAYEESHPLYAKILGNIGFVYNKQGNYGKALEFYNRCELIQRKELGESHPEYTTTLNNIGLAYFNQGKYNESSDYYNKCEMIQRAVLGDSHPDYANTLHNIGLLYKTQGNYIEALEYLKLGKNIRRIALGELHPGYATILNTIGGVYDSQGIYEKAVKYYRRCLNIQKLALGENHRDYAATLINIGFVYFNQGKYERALKYYKSGEEIQSNILEESNPEHATTFNNIGGVYEYQGKLGLALKYYNRCKLIRERVLGETHPQYATIVGNIGAILYKKGILKEALENYKQCAKIQREAFGELHKDYASTLSNIGVIYDKQENYAQALEAYNKCEKIQKEVLGESHPQYAATLSNLAWAHYSLSEYSNARVLIKASLDILASNKLSSTHPYYKSASELSELLSKRKS